MTTTESIPGLNAPCADYRNLPCPAGYGIAGSGFSRYYRTLPNAQRAFERLTSRGYICSVISHPNNPQGLRFAVLVSRY